MSEIRTPRINKVMLSGRITKDIEQKFTDKGTPVVKFTIAVDNNFKDSSGNWQNNPSFIDCIAWEKWADALVKQAHKGSPVIVEGKIEARSYVDKENNNRKAVEITAEYIQFLEYVKKDDDNPMQSAPQTTNDDVPF